MNNLEFINLLTKYFSYFLNEMKLTNKSKNTITSYTTTINSFNEFLSQYSNVNFSNLKKIDILNFLEWKNLTLEKHTELKISSKKLYITHLKTFFKFIKDNSNEEIDINKLFKLNIKLEKREPKGLSSNTKERILNYLNNLELNKFENVRLSMIVKLMLLGGARRQEVVNLSVSNINLKDNLYICRTIGKGNKERTIFLSKNLIEKEYEYLKQNNINYIASTNKYTRIDGTQVYKLVATLYKKLNIEYHGVHNLRHTFAKGLVQKNVNITYIKELLGHENIQTTMIYTQPNEKEVKRAYLQAVS